MPTLDYIYTNSKAVFRYLIYVFIAGVIAVFTYIPTFPVSFYDYSFFLGPVYEIANGKTIFTQIQAQYGFLTILLFSLLQKLSIFNIFYLPVIIWFLYIIEYLVAFYLILKISKSVVFSVIGLFSIITVGFFSPIFYPYTYPQVSPLRWLPMVLFLLLFYKFKNPVSKVLIFLTALISLFMIDSGIAIVLAYLFSLSILFLKKQISFSKIVISTLYLLISIIGIYLLIDFFGLLLGFKNINILSYFHTVAIYAHEGFYMIKIGYLSYFWLVVLVYLASIVYFIRKKNIDHLDMLLLLSANVVLFGSTYFVGRSHPNNLFHISILFLINFFILAGIAYKSIKQTWFKSIALLLLFLFFIMIPAYFRQDQIAFLLRAKSVSSNIFNSSLFNSETIFKNEKLLIKTYLKDNKVIILSIYDTYFFYLSGKQNLLRVNPQNTLNTRDELVASVEDAIKVCPKTIAVDCSIYGKCPKTISPDGTGAMRQEELLKEIQNRCEFVYEPVKCTNYLCIARKK